MYPRHGLAETINFVVAVPLNVFLLYLIRRFSRKELGAYKHLLTIFAAHGIFLSVVEALLSATAVRLGTITSVVCRTFLESRHVTCAYVSFYTIPFFLSNLNFLYRYLAIKRHEFKFIQQVCLPFRQLIFPAKLVIYSRKRFQFAMVLLITAAGSGWYLALFLFGGGSRNDPATILLRDFYKDKYNMTINDGWIVLEYWPNGSLGMRSFLVLVFTDTILIIQFLIAVSLSTMTFHHIRNMTTVSENYRKSQRRVLIALCAQAIVPLSCVYVPYANTLNAPFFDIDDFIEPETSASFLSAFPLWDAVVIILLMRDYRIGAINLVFGRKEKKKEPTIFIFTSAHVTTSPSQTKQS